MLPPRPEFKAGCHRYQIEQYEREKRQVGLHRRSGRPFPRALHRSMIKKLASSRPRGSSGPPAHDSDQVLRKSDGVCGDAGDEETLHAETTNTFFVAESAADPKITASCSALPHTYPVRLRA